MERSSSEDLEETTTFSLRLTTFVTGQFRLCFGESFTEKWGYFVERQMSRTIHSFADWMEDYPKGDHIVFKEEEKGEHTEDDSDDSQKKNLTCSVISNDGRYLFIGCEEGRIMMLDLISGKYSSSMIHEWIAHDRSVLCLAIHRNVLVSGGMDSSIKLWSAAHKGYLIRCLKGHSHYVTCLRINTKGDLIISGSKDGSIRVWSMCESGECLRTFQQRSAEEKEDSVRKVEWIKGVTTTTISISDLSDMIYIWDPFHHGSKRMKKADESYDGKYVWDLSVNCNGSLIACVLECDIRVLIWPDLNRRRTCRFTSNRCCFHPSNQWWLAVADRNDHHSLRIVNVRNGTSSLICSKKHTGKIRQLCFTPDGSRLVSVAEDHTARVWDLSVKSGRKLPR